MPTKVKLTSFFGIDIPFSDLLGCQLRESHRDFKNFYKVVNANLFPTALISLNLTQNIEFQDYSIPQFINSINFLKFSIKVTSRFSCLF